MPVWTVLLVSRAPSVIAAVRVAVGSIAHLSLEVRSDRKAASGLVPRENVVLVLAHLPACDDEAEVTRLLRAVAEARRPCATLVLTDRRCEPQVCALFRAGAADILELPAELPRLAHLADALTRRLAAPAPPPLPEEGDPDDGLESLMGQVRRVAGQDTTLLFSGETGTGKTRLARL
ncbi:MAG TPA: hypothetical protein VFE78_24870, partial [Gemmataceae bacterium]|nr:hypothetical protein [Gemmataceae bacterium]